MHLVSERPLTYYVVDTWTRQPGPAFQDAAKSGDVERLQVARRSSLTLALHVSDTRVVTFSSVRIEWPNTSLGPRERDRGVPLRLRERMPLGPDSGPRARPAGFDELPGSGTPEELRASAGRPREDSTG
jgi:hypothetical protein